MSLGPNLGWAAAPLDGRVSVVVVGRVAELEAAKPARAAYRTPGLALRVETP